MILINRFVRIYSYFPHIVLMFMFRLLLYGEQHQQHHVNATKITTNAGAGASGGVAPSTSSSSLPSTHTNNLARAYNTHTKSSTSERKINSGDGSGNPGEIFIAVIYPKSKETTFNRVIRQTVSSLSEDFTLATSLRVVPHFTAIADTDGYNVQEVQEVCKAWNHKPIIAAVVFSTFKSGFGHVLTSLHNNIPVLWATGEIQAGYFERVPLSRFDVRLDPGSYEVLRSLRSLLLATHWHAFTVMHTTTLLASQVYQDIINRPPLLPTILQFRPDSTSYYIFRLLSDVSKSTKGVIVLICEGIDAKRVIEESKKLNMVNGDFVWLWIDTSAVLIKDKTIRLEKVSKEINFVVETRKVRHAATASSVTMPVPVPTHAPATKTSTNNGATSDNKTNSATSATPVSDYNKTTNDRWRSNNPEAENAVPHQNKTDTDKHLSYKYFNTRNNTINVNVVVVDHSNTNDKVTTISYQNRTKTKNKSGSSFTRWPKMNRSRKVVAMAAGGNLYHENAEVDNEANDHSRRNTYYNRAGTILASTETNDGNDKRDTSLLNNEIPPFVSYYSDIHNRESASTQTAAAAVAAAASFNTLMKHHFSLYRKKNRRITSKAAVLNSTMAATMASTTATAPEIATISEDDNKLSSGTNMKRRKKNIPPFLATEANDGHVHILGRDHRNDEDQHRAVVQDHHSYFCDEDDKNCAFLVSSSVAMSMSTSTAPVTQHKIKRNEKHSTKSTKFAFVEKISISERSRNGYHHQQHRDSGSGGVLSQHGRKSSPDSSAPARSQSRYNLSATTSASSSYEESMENENEYMNDIDVDIVKRKASSQTQTQHTQDSSSAAPTTSTGVASAPVTPPYDFNMPVFLESNFTTPILLKNKTVPEMPVGILSLQLIPSKVDKNYVRSTVRLLINTLKEVFVRYGDTKLSKLLDLPRISCFDFSPVAHAPNSIMDELTQNLKRSVREAMAGRFRFNETHLEEAFNSSLAAKFKVLNLVPDDSRPSENKTALESRKWRTIGHMIGEDSVHLETIVWPGGDIVPVSTGRGSRSIFRIVTAFSPPFVMIGESDEDGQCLRGIECHQFLTSDKDNLTLLFNEMERNEEEDEVNVLDRLQLEKRQMWGDMDIRERHPGHKFKTNCCYGLSMDLLENVAEELEFDFQLYVVADGFFGTKTVSENGEQKWNGIMGDLVSGAAHLSFSALSVSSSRAQAIDFSAPYFFSGVSFLAAPKESTDIPLLAFLLPFSSNLWIAIFTSLHVTAAAVAIYEWLSPFGLNPWGRQRSKNFGVASALWVMWGLLCGHLVQFKAPKSWPNKFLINVWGGFSVIFIASYTANIAALIAGLFFHTSVGDHHDRSLLSQRVGAPKASAAEYYIRSSNQILWDHMQRYSVISIAEGVQLLKNGSLDILIADTPILDYYRATDHGCKLQRIGDTINEDTYAIGMTKGFPLKDSISAVIAKYSSNGYMDILQEKWYGGLPCFKLATDMAQPRPLGVAAVAGVFLMLGCGVLVGCLILFSEHLFYKYTLPSLRKKPKSSMWKSRNVMFFSQKLYRFINCVELVSPHHAARELVHTLRQGQITSLFQKSVRRKEHEQRQQQQKSKAQFFEMIQEIRRVQQEERKDNSGGKMTTGKSSPRKKYYGSKNAQILLSPTGLMKHRNRLSPGRLDFARRLSKDVFRSKSSGNLDVRRISSDINVAAGRFFDFYSAQAIGRRLSHGATDNSPPDMNARRASQFFKDDTFLVANINPNLSPCGAATDNDLVAVGGCSSAGNHLPLTAVVSSPSDSNLLKSPKSPKSPSSAHSSSGRVSSNSFFSRDIGPLAAKKFSNVESSSSFRGIKNNANKQLNKMNTPKVTINNQDFSGYEDFDDGGNNNDDEDDGYHLRSQHHLLIDDDSRASKAEEDEMRRCVESPEHIIEIVIPSSASSSSTTTMTTTAINQRIEEHSRTEDMSTNRGNSETKSSQSYTSVPTAYDYSAPNYSTTTGFASPRTPPLASQPLHDQQYDFKPKIILHLPPPKIKSTAKTSATTTAVPSTSSTQAAAIIDNSATSANLPLQRLSRDELMSLLQLSEKDLKENLLKALKEKDAAAVPM